MKLSLKKCGIVACIAGALILAWVNLRPLERVAVHQDDQLTYILVRNFLLLRSDSLSCRFLSRLLLNDNRTSSYN